MKRLSIALALSLLSATAAFAETNSQQCNPAQQNWMNGSGTTCSIIDQNSKKDDYRQMREAVAATA